MDPKPRYSEIITAQIPNGCGLACLAYANLILHGRYADQLKLGNQIDFTDQTSWTQMLQGAQYLGLRGEWVQKFKLDQLDYYVKCGAVVIVNWMAGRNHHLDGHYSVLESADSKFVMLQDPEYPGSRKILSRQVFDTHWFDLNDQLQKLDCGALILHRNTPLTPDQVREMAKIFAHLDLLDTLISGRITTLEHNDADTVIFKM